jgi:hypothetical protein
MCNSPPTQLGTHKIAIDSNHNTLAAANAGAGGSDT